MYFFKFITIKTSTSTDVSKIEIKSDYQKDYKSLI